MNKKELEKKVKDLSEDGQWNCHYDFPFGIKTRTKHINSPGYNLNKSLRCHAPIEEPLVRNNHMFM